jgi:TRAP-type C4-dicarboxylate transport system substrate-binding protein
VARNLIRSLAIFARVLGVLLCAASGAGVARSQELKISHEFRAEVDARDRAARLFVAEALKRAPHLKLSLHPDSSLNIRPIEQFDAMASGELAMSVYPLIYAAPKVPEFAITLFPFIPADLDMAMQLKGTPFHQKLQSIAEANGIRILTWWWLAGGMASRERDIGGPDTIKWLRISLSDPGFDRMFVTAGARIAERTPSSEIKAALRDGRLDVVLTSLESLAGFRIFEEAKATTIGGLGIFMSFQPLVISKVVWDGLSVDEKYALEGAAEASNKYFEAMQREAEQQAIAVFAGAGAKIRRLELNEYEAWLRVAKDTVWPEYRRISPAADELFVTLLTSLMQSDRKDKASQIPGARPGN